MPASNCEDNWNSGQVTNKSLPNREDACANAAQLGYTAERCIPWLRDNLEDSGLKPGFLLLFSLVMPFLIVLFIWIMMIVIGVPFWKWNVYGPLLAFPWAIASITNWSPLIGACFILRYGTNRPLKKLAFVTVIVIGACLFRLLSWGYCVLVLSERVGIWYNMMFGQHMQTWSTGTVPQSFRGYDARVEPS